MFRLHILVALRNLKKSKTSFLINLTGLSAGLACFMLIMLWVQDELDIDKFHDKDTRLFQVMEHQQYDGDIMTTTSTPGLLAETLAEEIPEVEYAATTTWINRATLTVGDLNIKADGFNVGKDFFNIFSYDLYQGDPDKVLEDKTSIVISESLANSLFETDKAAVGRMVEVQHDKSYIVSGIFRDIPSKSSYQFEYVISFEDFKDDNDWVTSWGNNGPSTYLTLNNGDKATDVSEKIADFVAKRNEFSNVTLFLQPYSERYLYGSFSNGVKDGGRIEYVRLFAIIAIIILLIACINFMNLSTARASKRALEVGIKKAIGARLSTLVGQFLIESVVLAMLSMLTALCFIWLFLPRFNAITDKQIALEGSPAQWAFCLGVAVLTGLMAGSYPAFYLSNFEPVKVLKGTVKGSIGELWVRRGLVIFQFTLSVILIVSVFAIYRQIEFVQNKNLGYDKENVIRFPIEGRVEDNLSSFLSSVKRIPGVVNVSSLGHTMIGRQNNTSGLEWEGKNPEQRVLFENVRVNYDLIETMDIELVEGRAFNNAFGADTSNIIFNQAAINILGFDEPIGKTIRLWDEYDLTIIGVLKNFHFQSLHDDIEPLFMMLDPDNTWNIMLRIEQDREKDVIAALKEFYATYNPGFTFDYDFMDQEYANMYRSEQRVSTLSQYFAGLAIIISCLGLFGLAAYIAGQRFKEIGIRKTLGAGTFNIVLLLSKDFTKLVILSIILALPISYYLMQQWMSQFAYRINLGPWIFIMAGCTALIISWLTISTQAMRAASVNPAECLRDN